MELGGWGRGKDLKGDEGRETIINIFCMKNYFQQVIYAFLSSTLFFKNDFKKVQIYDRKSKSMDNLLLSLTWAWKYLNPSFSYSVKIISEVSLWNSLSPEILICLLKDFYNLVTRFISEVTS